MLVAVILLVTHLSLIISVEAAEDTRISRVCGDGPSQKQDSFFNTPSTSLLEFASSTPIFRYPMDIWPDINGTSVYCGAPCKSCVMHVPIRFKNPIDSNLQLLLDDDADPLFTQLVPADQLIETTLTVSLQSLLSGRHRLSLIGTASVSPHCTRSIFVDFRIVRPRENEREGEQWADDRDEEWLPMDNENFSAGKDAVYGEYVRHVLVSYSTSNFRQSQYILSESALTVGGFDEVEMFTESDIPQSFVRRVGATMCNQRGAGYWLWKPYILNETLHRVREGDVVIFMDSGMSVLGNMEPLFRLIRTTPPGIVVFDQRMFREERHTKHDVFVEMNADEESIRSTSQMGAFSMGFRNCPSARKFVQEWLEWGMLDGGRLIDDSPNIHGDNPPDFYEHRHDQSILSVLTKKWGLPGYPEVSEKGLNAHGFIELKASGQLMWHHRHKQPQWGDKREMWGPYCRMAIGQQKESRLFTHMPDMEVYVPWCTDYRCTPVEDRCGLVNATFTFN